MRNKFPSEWRKEKLGNVCKYISRGKSPKYVEKSRIAVINQKCIYWDGFHEENVKYLDESKASTYTEDRFVNPGDVLLNSTGTGTIGRAIVFPGGAVGRYVTDSHVTVVRTDAANLLAEYLVYWLSTSEGQRQLETECYSGSTNQIELNKSKLEGLEVVLPPLPEQREISAILTSVDDAIAATQRIIDQTERVKRGLMQQLLTRGIGHTKFKKTEIGEIPAEWEVAHFSKYCRVNPTYTVNNGTKCAYVEMAAVDETSPDIRYYGERAVGQTSGSRFKEGDVLFARITPCTENGKTALVRNLPTEVGIGSTEFIVLSPDKKKLVPMYLYYLAKSDSVRNYAIGRMTGTTGRQRVPKEVFTEELIIPIPPLSEQIKICKMLEAHDSRLTIEKAYREKLKTLRTALMQILLTGKVRVKVEEEAEAVV